jgi:hypothetical protein
MKKLICCDGAISSLGTIRHSQECYFNFEGIKG